MLKIGLAISIVSVFIVILAIEVLIRFSNIFRKDENLIMVI